VKGTLEDIHSVDVHAELNPLILHIAQMAWINKRPTTIITSQVTSQDYVVQDSMASDRIIAGLQSELIAWALGRFNRLVESRANLLAV